MNPNDRQHAEASLGEEKEAIKVYGDRLKTSKSPKLKRALSHARGEEQEHARGFRAVLVTEGVAPNLFRYLGHFAKPDVLAVGHNPGMEKTMHEFKAGKLHSGSKKGPVVTSRKQAIAIGMSEARRGK